MQLDDKMKERIKHVVSRRYAGLIAAAEQRLLDYLGNEKFTSGQGLRRFMFMEPDLTLERAGYIRREGHLLCFKIYPGSLLEET